MVIAVNSFEAVVVMSLGRRVAAHHMAQYSTRRRGRVAGAASTCTYTSL